MVLNFHGVGPLTRRLDNGEHQCWLEESTFYQILDWIRETPGIRITFDDGNESDHSVALPALRQRGLTAKYFVCSGRIGQSTFVNERQIQELHASGMVVGSHGIHHRDWRSLQDEQLNAELNQARVSLENIVKVPVNEVACPFGSYDRRVLRYAKEGGIEVIHTSDGGIGREGAWLRPRRTVTRSCSIQSLKNYLAQEALWHRRIYLAMRIVAKSLR